ncbi:hypothetical protein [Streptomyces sp. 1222.5]|uniref:hypothetical protein n=1 Tax=Streptomyces sp. 1222.5 TaxID=1881026 RepID=UPI003EB76494
MPCAAATTSLGEVPDDRRTAEFHKAARALLKEPLLLAAACFAASSASCRRCSERSCTRRGEERHAHGKDALAAGGGRHLFGQAAESDLGLPAFQCGQRQASRGRRGAATRA